jgi:hypothetical protein
VDRMQLHQNHHSIHRSTGAAKSTEGLLSSLTVT